VPNPVVEEPAAAKVLEELLELTRNNHRILRDPTSLLPSDYLEAVLGRQSRDIPYSSALRDVEKFRDVAWHFLKQLESELADEPRVSLMEAIDALEKLERPLTYLLSRARASRNTVSLSKYFEKDKP